MKKNILWVLIFIVLLNISLSNVHATIFLLQDVLKDTTAYVSGNDYIIAYKGTEALRLVPKAQIGGMIKSLEQLKSIDPSITLSYPTKQQTKIIKWGANFSGIKQTTIDQTEAIIFNITTKNKVTYNTDEIILDNGLSINFADLISSGHEIVLNETTKTLTIWNLSNSYNTLKQTLYLDPTIQSTCGTISSSGEYTLNQSIESTGTCITITTNDVKLDCAGYTIRHDTAGSGGDGVVAASRTNLSVHNCRIEDGNAAGAQGIGISFTGVVNSTIHNNTIQTNGTDSNHGIYLTASANNNTITNNTINTQGSSSLNIGIYLLTTVSGNIITNNTINTDGTNTNNGIRLQSSASNNTIANNIINTKGTSLANVGIYFINTVSGNTITQNIITTNGTSDNYGILIDTSANNNTITNNTINARGTTSANYGIYLLTTVSGNIITNNSIQTNGTSNNQGIRLESSANNNTITNNTISTQGTTSANYGIYLFTTVSGNTIIANTITTNGTDSNYGIVLFSSANNNTITNNTINARGTTSANYGIFLSTTVSGNTVSQNTITTNGTSQNYGIILFTNANNNTINNNTITTQGTAGSNIGIYLTTTVSGNTVSQNTITTNGTNTNQGIRLQTSADNNTINNNTISTQGTTTDNHGIVLVTSSNDNVFEANTITSNGSSSTYGIRILSGSIRNQLRYNTITGDGKAGNRVISIEAGNNTFIGNTITAALPHAPGIQIISANHTVLENNIIANMTTWISPGTGISNFTNTTFETRDGKISLLSLFNITNIREINQTVLNITLNNSFLNSTLHPNMNVSSQISLFGINLLVPKIQADYDDDEIFNDCNSPICINQSYNNGIFIFNVSHFTTFRVVELTNVAPNISFNMSLWPNGTNTHLNESVDVVINFTYADTDGDAGNMTALWFINNTNTINHTILIVSPNITYQFNLSNTTFGRNATIYVNITGYDNQSAQSNTITSFNVTVANIPPPQISNLSITNSQRVRQNFTINWNQTGDQDDPMSNLGWNTTVNGTAFCGRKNATTSCLVLARPAGQNSFNITTLDGENYTSNALTEVIVDEIAPFYTNLSNHSLQQTGITINWTASEPVNYTINYSNDCAKLDNSVSSNTFETSSNVTITGLIPGNEYCYIVTLMDNVTSEFGANINRTSIYRFTTLGQTQHTSSYGSGGGEIYVFAPNISTNFSKQLIEEIKGQIVEDEKFKESLISSVIDKTKTQTNAVYQMIKDKPSIMVYVIGAISSALIAIYKIRKNYKGEESMMEN